MSPLWSVCILKFSALFKMMFALFGICTTIFSSCIAIVYACSSMFCICPCVDMMYAICLILFGSISCVVVANNFLDCLVMVFIFLSFSEKYHRWFPRSVPNALRYMMLRFSVGSI